MPHSRMCHQCGLLWQEIWPVHRLLLGVQTSQRRDVLSFVCITVLSETGIVCVSGGFWKLLCDTACRVDKTKLHPQGGLQDRMRMAV